MTHIARLYSHLRFLRSKKVIIAIAAIIVVILGYSLFHKDPVYHFIPVERGSVVEQVSVTGNTAPVKSVSLGFASAGKIASVSADVGDHVRSGQVLARLSTGELSAQIAQAQAQLAMQQAKLDGLRAGSRPEDIAASQASLEKAQQDLENLYASIIDTSIEGFAKADDTLHVQLDGFFEDEESAPSLTYFSGEQEAAGAAQAQRMIALQRLDAWHSAIVASPSTDEAREALLEKGLSTLSSLRELLRSISITLEDATLLDDDTVAAYKERVNTALTEVNAASKSLNTTSQQIASQQLTVSQAQAQLSLKQAGTAPADIEAQEAQVRSAEANLASVESKAADARIVSPIDGVITRMDAKVGQAASPSEPLVSIISDGAFEIDAAVSEIDVGRIAVGDPVEVTFDALPDETFTGSVFYINPAQTSNEGVVGYDIKVSLESSDPRIKSGLTANLDITTDRKDDVLTLPQYAIVQNDDGAFVETLVDGSPTTTPVTLGISDEEGRVEIRSGVHEGQQVLNIGLKR